MDNMASENMELRERIQARPTNILGLFATTTTCGGRQQNLVLDLMRDGSQKEISSL